MMMANTSGTMMVLPMYNIVNKVKRPTRKMLTRAYNGILKSFPITIVKT